jgi:voltage-gated potassium channel
VADRVDRRRVQTRRNVAIILPGGGAGPLWAIARRLLGAVAILLAVVAVVLLDRDGYRDVTGDRVGVLDAFYYATVTLSTTGYGDVTPVSNTARLLNVLFVAPARVLFLIILVGTTLEVLTERSREQFRIRRWRSRVHQHVVVCGYGTKGRSAVDALLDDGTPQDQIVIVEQDGAAVRDAVARGLAVVQGSSSRAATLREAQVDEARSVVVATNADDAAVLTVLTARDLAPHAWIVAAVRESENVPLVKQSGADQLVTVVEDLLTASAGMALTTRPVAADEVGRAPLDVGQPVVGVIRDGTLHRYDDPKVARLLDGDRVVCVAVVDPPGTT